MTAHPSETLDGLAGQLRAAFDANDPAALAPLLHPDVRWGGDEDTEQTCHNRAEVLGWLGNLQAQGVRATVIESFVHPDSVILHVVAVIPGSGAEDIYQVFKVADAQVVEIRGYPELTEAEAFVAPGSAPGAAPGAAPGSAPGG